MSPRILGLCLWLGTGCATGGLDVEASPITAPENLPHLTVSPKDGGFSADVGFYKKDGPAPQVRAELVDGNTIELHFDYRLGRNKCIDRKAYRVQVVGLAAGQYEVVAKHRGDTLGTATVEVSTGVTEPAPQWGLARVSGSGGC